LFGISGTINSIINHIEKALRHEKKRYIFKQWMILPKVFLGGGFNPFEKY